MSFERRHIASSAALALSLSLLVSGCAMQLGGGSATSGERPSESTSRAEQTSRTESPSTVAVEPAETSEQEVSGPDSVIAAILAERRRGDYPEIELWESGFTITERSRIGSQARTDYERALSLLNQQRYAEGIAVLETVTAAAPDVTAPYVDLGLAYGQVGDLEQAEQALATADLLSPNNPIIKNELGIVYRKSGRFAEARASYESALAVYQGYHFAQRNLAVLCDLYLADLECALANYRAYLTSVGTDPEVEIWVADLENRLGR
ncbi:MAG: tetratricopeptide repeat protein [Gammaproteobacteria bacterium]|jgi:Flp pilus assembly protein TadD